MTDESIPPESRTNQSTEVRYGRLTLDDATVIVYDRNHTSAWIQSDVAYPIPTRTTAVGDATAEATLDGGSPETEGN